jgi:perosamine synthetase
LLSTDFNGVPADMFGLRQVADEFGLWLIADAAQSFGARLDGQAASSTADVVVTSLTCGKPLFAGEGAVILTRHSEVYERLLWYTQHPCRQRRELGLHLFNEFAMNFRIHPLAAVWANAIFDITLSGITDAQIIWLEVISKIEALNLIQPTRYSLETLCPSFFHVLVRPTGDEETADLHRAARHLGVEACPFSICPLYRNPTLRLLHRRLLSVSKCERAEALCQSTLLQLGTRYGGAPCKTC